VRVSLVAIYEEMKENSVKMMKNKQVRARFLRVCVCVPVGKIAKKTV